MNFQAKSTVSDIRERFDNDVERFSVLATGQSTTVDAPLVLELITSAAATVTPDGKNGLDIGCGAGNYSLKLLEKLPDLNLTLVDLSRPMLDKATERLSAAPAGEVTTYQADIRDLPLPENHFDVIMAAAVLHHLRDDAEWELVFRKLYRALKPGGGLWISDMIEHNTTVVQQMMVERYGAYLAELKDEAYRDHVFAYVAKEDSPRPLMYQIDLLREVGFQEVEILHKNSIFAAFGGLKPA